MVESLSPHNRYNLIIDTENEDKFRQWYNERGGVVCWENLEIGGSAATEVFTPLHDSNGNENLTAPNWRYGRPSLVNRDSLRVQDFRVVEKFRGRIVKKYWGYDLLPASENKAKRLVEKLPPITGELASSRWTLEYEYGNVFAQIEIGYEITREFDLTE